MIDITNYHWVWYLLGFLCWPRLTFMIWLSIYFSQAFPTLVYIILWTITILNSIKITTR
jgi:hypothetical protein